jgi:nucleoside phosphorylase
VTSPLLFVASDRREAEPWVQCWENSRDAKLPVHWSRTGKWRNREVIAIANGIGPARAKAAIHATGKTFSGICSIGTGGALDTSLSIADVVVATAVTDGKTTWPSLDPNGPAARSGVVRTNAHIARTSDEKTNLQRSGAILVEMEAAAVAASALELAVPFYCVRVVSDCAHETFFIDFERFFMPDGRFNVPRLVMAALSHPFKSIPELLRLQKRTAQAAQELGRFLENCTF